MSRPCPDLLRFLNVSRPDSRRDGAADGAEREHVETCRRCQEELAALRHIQASLSDLVREERAAAPVAAWWGPIESRLDSPGPWSRLPMPLVGATRLLQEALKPAVAAAWAAGVAGLVLGVWLAARGPAPVDESYAWSSLVDGGSLSAMYETSFDDAADPLQDVLPDDSSNVETPMGGAP